MRSLRTALATTGALALLLPFASTASAAYPLNRACSNGPYTGPTSSGTVAGCTTRVSLSYQNTEPDNTSQRPRISEDGNFVVFQSGADRLVPGWTPGHGSDDYWVDKRDPAGTIQMVDVAANGGMPNSQAGRGATFVDVSANGRYVAFFSSATNLVAGTTTRAGSIFLRDMLLKKTIEVPHSDTGGETNDYSNRPTISGYPDSGGNYYVTYNGKGTNLVPGNTHSDDIYVTRFNPHTLTVTLPALVSRTATGGGSDGENEHAEISSDGNYIAWQSDASNLGGPYNGKTQIYESANPLTVPGARPLLVSVSSAGTLGNQASTRPAINGNGNEVAWQSVASNLVPGDTNLVLDAFLRGTRTGAFIGAGKTIRVSVDYNGNQLAGASQRPNLDGAGDTVGFAANAHTVVKGDTNNQRDVFIRDLRTGVNTLVDVCQSGGFGGVLSSPCRPAAAMASADRSVAPHARAGGEDLSSRAFLSYDGRSVAFISGMSDLVPNDTNANTSLDDIFVRDFGTATTPGTNVFGANESWATSPFYGAHGTAFADVNRDGKADAIAVHSTGILVKLSTGSGFGDTAAWTTYPYYGSNGTVFADVNGDGRADVVAIHSTGLLVKRSNGSAFGDTEAWTSGAYYGSVATFVADVNGDDRADAIAVNSNGVFVRLSTGASFGATKIWAGPFYGSAGTFVADVNGDGKADVIAVNAAGTTVRLSTGTSFGANSPTSTALTTGSGLRFADVTGDGKADAVVFGSSNVTVYYSAGNTFGTAHAWTNNPFYGNVATACADVTGDRRADAIAVNTSGIVVRRAQ